MIARLRRLLASRSRRRAGSGSGRDTDRAAGRRAGEEEAQRIDAARRRLKATIPPPEDSA